jgi:hypothetical protein
MDADRFDDLARRVASGSRRHLLGGLLAGLGASFGIQDAGAKKKKEGSEQDPPAEQLTGKGKRSQTEQNSGAVDSPDIDQPPPEPPQDNAHQRKDKQQDHPRGKRQDTADALKSPEIQQDKPKSQQRDPGDREDKQQARGGSDQKNDGSNDQGSDEKQAGG